MADDETRMLRWAEGGVCVFLLVVHGGVQVMAKAARGRVRRANGWYSG